jgi:hypothetical protein
VRLGSEVHHKIMTAYQFVHQTRITDVAPNEREAILGQAFQRLSISGVGELV